jgi:hypothetical protein
MMAAGKGKSRATVEGKKDGEEGKRSRKVRKT